MVMKILIVIIAFISVNAHAGWINATGTVEQIVTYAHTETILVSISVDGQDVEACSNKKTFAISSAMTEEGRARMYSMLLAAQATGRSVVVSFLDVGGCEAWFSTANVYRRISRMR